MDAELDTRLHIVGKELEQALEPSGKFDRFPSNTTRGSCRILNKWKYKPKKIQYNRFLDAINQKSYPYENTLVSIRKEYPGFNLHSYEDLMGRCKRIQQGTRERWLDWDNMWINPIRLSSKGWDFSGLKNGNLICQCVTCSEMLGLELGSSSEELNKRYWERGVSLEHSIECPWRRNQFDLINGYYLQPWNLIHESELVKGNSQDELVLQGYEILEDDILQCTGCYRKTFTKSVLENRTNYHAGWCKYYDSKKLGRLFGNTVEISADKSICDRLSSLGNFFECI